MTATGSRYPGMTTTSIILGSAIGLSAIPGLLGNILAIVTVIKGGFLDKKQPQFYLLLLSLAVADSIMLANFLFYLCPASILQDFLLPSPWEVVPGIVFVITWDHMWFMLSLVAINRYMAVAKPVLYKHFWTRKKTMLMVAISWTLSFLIITHALWVPCCVAYMNPFVYTIAWRQADVNLTNIPEYMSEIPGNASTTLITSLCYILFFWQIRKQDLDFVPGDSGDLGHERAGGVLVEWISFLIILNSTANPLIYFTFNHALRKQAALIIRCRQHQQTNTVTPYTVPSSLPAAK